MTNFHELTTFPYSKTTWEVTCQVKARSIDIVIGFDVKWMFLVLLLFSPAEFENGVFDIILCNEGYKVECCLCGSCVKKHVFGFPSVARELWSRSDVSSDEFPAFFLFTPYFLLNLFSLFNFQQWIIKFISLFITRSVCEKKNVLLIVMWFEKKVCDWLNICGFKWIFNR